MRNKIKMHLKDKHFKMMKNGSKKVEVRLNDGKRRELKIGDIISFKNLETGEELERKVKRIKLFTMPFRLLGRYRLQDFGDEYKETKDLLEEIHSIYGLVDIHRYGIMAIELSEVE
ncbi:ASCH domain-containing protein [Peptostreptococcus anaerobius]